MEPQQKITNKEIALLNIKGRSSLRQLLNLCKMTITSYNHYISCKGFSWDEANESYHN